MGASGVPIVAANLTVVKRKGAKAYIRSKINNVVSARLAAFNSCIRQQMTGKHGSQQDIRDAFTSAARSCSGRGGAPAAGRRMGRFR